MLPKKSNMFNFLTKCAKRYENNTPKQEVTNKGLYSVIIVENKILNSKKILIRINLYIHISLSITII